VFSICGDAGTGKSRLVMEFKESLEPGKIQWLEAHAYAYTQNIPYHPLVDFFNRTFGIEEGDRSERIREKIEFFLKDLLAERENLIPYMGSLYSLRYPEAEGVSPEFWKGRLREAVKCILSALLLKGPTVFFLEDLHWADPSFVELLRRTIQEVQRPAIVLCAYRPGFSLFTSPPKGRAWGFIQGGPPPGSLRLGSHGHVGVPSSDR
jgi:predicted ATPase